MYIKLNTIVVFFISQYLHTLIPTRVIVSLFIKLTTHLKTRNDKCNFVKYIHTQLYIILILHSQLYRCKNF